MGGCNMFVRRVGTAIIAALLCLGLAGVARAADKNVIAYEVQHGDTTYIMAKMENCSEATITSIS